MTGARRSNAFQQHWQAQMARRPNCIRRTIFLTFLFIIALSLSFSLYFRYQVSFPFLRQSSSSFSPSSLSTNANAHACNISLLFSDPASPLASPSLCPLPPIEFASLQQDYFCTHIYNPKSHIRRSVVVDSDGKMFNPKRIPSSMFSYGRSKSKTTSSLPSKSAPPPSTPSPTLNSTFHQFVMHLLPTTHDIVSGDVYKGVGWDVSTSSGILNLLRKEQTRLHLYTNNKKLRPIFLDVGANVGWFTLMIASFGYPVFAFEPLPDNTRVLRSSICANSREGTNLPITFFPYGASESTSSCTLYSHNRNIGDGHVSCNKTVLIPKGYQIRGRLHLGRLDEFLPSNIEVAVMKIDVEGFEYYSLKGLHNLLITHQIRNIIAEYSPRMMSDTGMAEPWRLLEYMHELGYTIRHIRGKFNYTRVLAPEDFQTFCTIPKPLICDLYMHV